jgi:hypothetical protein
MWRGRETQKPYQVQVEAEGEPPIVLQGALNQRPVIPKWVFAAAAIIAAALLLWFLLIKPAVHSTAVNANKNALAAQRNLTSTLSSQLGQTQQQSTSNSSAIVQLQHQPTSPTTAKPKGKPPTTTTTSTTKPTTGTTQPPPVTLASDGNISLVVAPGGSQSTSSGPVGTGTTIQISDLIIENVSGSSGTARVERVANGQTEVLLVENLANLNGQEYHFNTPIMFTHTQKLQLEVDCGSNQTFCSVNLYYTGPITEPQSVTTTTAP